MATAEGRVVIVRIAVHVVTEGHAAIVPMVIVLVAAVAVDATVLVEVVQVGTDPEEIDPEATVPAAIVPAAIVPAAIVPAALVRMLFLSVHGQSACAQVAHTEQRFLTRSR